MYEGNPALFKNLYVQGHSGELMSIFMEEGLDMSGFTHVQFTATSTSGPGAWILMGLATAPMRAAGVPEPVYVSPTGWQTYTVLLESLLSPDHEDGYVGLAFWGDTDSGTRESNEVAFGDIGLVRLAGFEPPVVAGTPAAQ